MKGKSTTDLSRGLMSEANLNTYLVRNQASFSKQNITEPLKRLYRTTGLSKAEVARRASISEVFLHQVFSGRRLPSRNRMLCICVGLNATLEETQQLLKEAAYAPLYPRRKRDAIIIHGILHRTPLGEINDKLFTEQEETLF